LAIGVLTRVVLLGLALRQADRDSETGQWARRRGMGLIHLVSTQVALGIVAVIFVTMGDAQRPIPGSTELDEAHALPVVEAVFTTAHQALGAAILALTAATFIRIRPENRPR
jgi:heme A synthase